MRVTRGDNFVFLFLPALTVLGLAGTYVAGKIRMALNPIVITVSDSSSAKISKLTVTCSGSTQTSLLKTNGLVQFEFPVCEGQVSLSRDDVSLGICTPREGEFSRLKIDLKDQKISDSDCHFK